MTVAREMNVIKTAIGTLLEYLKNQLGDRSTCKKYIYAVSKSQIDLTAHNNDQSVCAELNFSIIVSLEFHLREYLYD